MSVKRRTTPICGTTARGFVAAVSGGVMSLSTGLTLDINQDVVVILAKQPQASVNNTGGMAWSLKNFNYCFRHRVTSARYVAPNRDRNRLTLTTVTPVNIHRAGRVSDVGGVCSAGNATSSWSEWWATHISERLRVVLRSLMSACFITLETHQQTSYVPAARIELASNHCGSQN